ncbi:MAG TPA: BMP family ABC transporter substrate-binding protein [Pyrinomonadaceae bacterium]|nr:BMP family ABC transporter substrate-binding protein [Pyrinomonadaceae bacterium]
MKVVICATLVILCLLLAIFGSGCNRSYGADDKSKIRVGIVFDIGGKDDRSFNAAAWAGAKCAETGKWPDGTSCGKPALPIVLRDIEPGNPTSIEPAMRAFAERNYDLIIGIGFAQTPIIELVAKDYPNIRFAIVDGVSDLPNVASLIFKEHEGSYLVGMLAAKTSKTGTIGFLGGMDIGLIHRFKGGYEEGARAVNPNIRVIPNYVGVTDAAWNNPGKGKEIALAQISKGADVIFTAAGNSGLGAFDAVEQAGRQDGRATHFVIGVDANQNMVKPGFVLTSMVKRVDNAVYAIVQDVVNGQFKAGFHVYGLNEDGVGYAMDENNKNLVTPEMVEQVEAAKKKIISGEIQVVDLMGK